MHAASAAALLAAAALAVLFAFPLSAQAMEVERWTAQPNDDALEKVMGATPTRVTWQGQTAEDESLSALAIDLPEGSSVDAENVKVTVMNGLDRLDVASKVQVDGGSLVTVTFPEATPAGSLVMVECNRTLLPGDGGTFGLTGSYTTADGQTLDMPATDKTFDVVSTSPAEQLSTWLGMQDWVKAWNSNKFLHLFFDPSIIVTLSPSRSSSSAFRWPFPSAFCGRSCAWRKAVSRALWALRTSTSCAVRRCFCRYTSRFSVCRCSALKWICSCWAQSSSC